jgi:putative ABC transport system permease protein
MHFEPGEKGERDMKLPLWRRRQREAEPEEDIQNHLQMAARDQMERGTRAEEASSVARREFGNTGLIKDTTRSMWGLRTLEALWQDFRYGTRMLLKQPGFTLIAVLTLSLGIGANTAIFSVVDAVLLRPLPYRDPDRLVRLWSTFESVGVPFSGSAMPDYLEWRDRNQVFADLGAFYYGSFNLTGQDRDAEQVQGAYVTSNFFPMLGVAPAIGRGFAPEDELFGNHRVVLLSYQLWQLRYGGDPQVVGRGIRLGGQTYTIIGVMPQGMPFLYNRPMVALWTPISFAPGDNWGTRSIHFIFLLGRLKAGVSIEQAQADVSEIALRVAEEHPENKGIGGRVMSIRDSISDDTQRGLLVLLVAVAFVLLVACVNVANLLLARAATRERELGIRAALGASRGRLISQSMLENLPLGLLGGAAGLALAFWEMELVVSLLPRSLPRHNTISIDGRVLSFTLLISLLTFTIFSLLPTFQVAKSDAGKALNEGGRSNTAGRRRNRLRDLLVVAEMALALVLLIGAGLMIQSFVKLHQIDLGFSTNVLTMRVSLPNAKYPTADSGIAFFEQMLERIAALPGVKSAAVSMRLPLGIGESIGKNIRVVGRPTSGSSEQAPLVRCISVSPDYFGTMGIILRGRDFTKLDTAKAQQVVIINETLARRFFPNEDPLGKTIRLEVGDTPRRTIVGIIADAKGPNLTAGPETELYVPLHQYDGACWRNDMRVAVQSSVAPDSLTAAIRNQLSSLDGDQPVTDIATMEELVSRALSPDHFSALLLGLFAGVALLLAAVGIYGVMAYMVTERTNEIGIRMALGAQIKDVIRLVIGRGIKLAFIGIVIGMGGALALTRLMRTLLFGVSTTDPLTFAAIAILLMVVAVLACWIPARRAAKVYPMVALRRE